MLRQTRKSITLLAAGVLLLTLGVAPEPPAEAQDGRGTQAELVDRLLADGLTREQLVSLYVSLAGAQFQPPACVAGQEMFADVPATNPSCPWIEELVRRGIAGGCGGGNFCPAAPVTRAQMAVFIVKALDTTKDCNAGLAANDEMVRVGSVCIDKYEASIWTKRRGGSQITGTIPCSPSGRDCKDKIFARSVAGVQPRTHITWFQAQAALENSGKRLPTNAEWQMAVAGTPDDTGPETTPCNTRSDGPVETGSLPGCASFHDVFDMVGNVDEWVADWVPASTACPGWGSFSNDYMCLSGASNLLEYPGALTRGGHFSDDANAGPFAVRGGRQPSETGSTFLSFRGAR